jgi:hypothetical protein
MTIFTLLSNIIGLRKVSAAIDCVTLIPVFSSANLLDYYFFKPGSWLLYKTSKVARGQVNVEAKFLFKLGLPRKLLPIILLNEGLRVTAPSCWEKALLISSSFN